MQKLIGFDGFIELALAQVTPAHGPSVNTIAHQVVLLHIETGVSQLVLQI